MVLPLLAIALSFDLVAGDDGAGRVPLLLSASGSLGRVALRRAALRWVALCFAALAPIVVAAPRVNDAVGLLGMASCACVHVAFWFALALAISRAHVSAVRTGVALVSTWAVLVLVVPGMDRWAEATRGFVVQGRLLSPDDIATLPRFEPPVQRANALVAAGTAAWTGTVSMFLVLIGFIGLGRRK